MDCSLPGSSIHGIFQARVLECVAIAFSEAVLQLADNHEEAALCVELLLTSGEHELVATLFAN